MRQRTPFVYLTKEEERELISRWQNSRDKRALNRLLENCELLIYKYVHRVARPYEERFDNLLQEGRLGVIQAATKFDLKIDVRFITYAMWWIRAHVNRTRFPRNEIPTISLSSSSADNSENGHGEKQLQDLIGDLTFSPEHVLGLDKISDESLVRQVVDRTLTKRERDIIIRRYLSGDDETLEMVGEIYDLSRERVRQIELMALKKIRRNLESWDERVEYKRTLQNGEMVSTPTFDPADKPSQNQTRGMEMTDFDKAIIETIKILGGDKRWLKSNEITKTMMGSSQFGEISTLSVGHACGKLATAGLLARVVREPHRFYALPGLEPPQTEQTSRSLARANRGQAIEPSGSSLGNLPPHNLTPAGLAIKILGVGDQIAGLALKIKGVADILKEVPPQHQEGVLQAAKLLLRG